MGDLTGAVMVYVPTANVATIDRRKEDDTGWWLVGGGGLSDRVIADGTWRPLGDILTEGQRLRDLLQSATPTEMGGTPDLFYPAGYYGDDPWGDWEKAVNAALKGVRS